jgi:hypothetical protein
MDKHLGHLVKQTERYTRLLVSNMELGGSIGQNIVRSHQQSRSKRLCLESAVENMEVVKIGEEDVSDNSSEDYVLEEELDDETTLIEEEAVAAHDDTNYEDEITKLQGDSEIPIEELRAMYSGMGDDELISDEESVQDREENENENEDENENDQVVDQVVSDGGEEESKLDISNPHSLKRPYSHVDEVDDTFDGSMKRLEAAEIIARSIDVDFPFPILDLTTPLG